MISRRFLAFSASLAVVGLLSGCPDTEGELNDFIERYEKLYPPTTSSSSGVGGGCSAPAAGEIDGNFLFALSAKVDPTNPVLFDADITTADGASGLELSLTLQPLDAKDRKTPVGSSITLGPFAVEADGTFVADFPPLDVPGAANPISGSDLSADVEISGSLCTPDLICGGLDGDVTKPVTLNIDGSSFTFERLEAEGVFPEPPVINCAGKEAKPLM